MHVHIVFGKMLRNDVWQQSMWVYTVVYLQFILV